MRSIKFIRHSRMRILYLTVGLQIVWGLTSYALYLVPDRNRAFITGLELLNKAQYEAAQHAFEAYIHWHENDLKTIEAQYYAALCAIKLCRPDGVQRFHQFVKQHPQHRKATFAYYQLGNFYFAKQDFKKSLVYYLQVDQSQLDEATQYALQYCLAYAYLSEKDFDQATQYFNALKLHANPYYHAANYYAGYIAFRKEAYELALTNLKKASENEAYQPVVPYLVLQIYYQQKRFQALLDYSNECRQAAIVLTNQEEIALLTAEAYFFLQDYAQAVPHYEAYLVHQDGALNRPIVYRTAYSLYKTQERHKALPYFKAVALQDDALGQSASYYMGLCYLQTNQKTLALAALEKAQKSSFCSEVQEEAAFQYAKVNYELGHFGRAIDVLKKCKQNYQKHLPEVNALLSEAYRCTNDYDVAITHIEGLTHKPESSLKVYQQVTFYRGSEYFNEAMYDQAIDLLQKSLSVPLDQDLVLQAQLWLGESLSALQRYAAAIPTYQKVLKALDKQAPYYGQALYGLAYAYFNTGDYGQALANFAQYRAIAQGATSWCNDALVRLADCYYAIKDYPQALQLYDQVLPHQLAYSHYQKALVYDILGDVEAAQKSLQVIFNQYKHTVYYEKALFENACITFAQNDYLLAIQQFTTFLQKKPHSTLLPDALLKRAIAYTNLQKYPAACQDYETLLKDYPTHPNAQSALLALPKLLTLAGKAAKMTEYLASYQAANPNEASIGCLALETAKTLLYNQCYAQAITQLETAIAHDPQSRLEQEAIFLMAEAYYRLGNDTQALVCYTRALHDKKTPFYNKIILRIATLSYQQKDFPKALDYYQQLQACASNKKENYYALQGMMKASYALQQYDNVTKAASLIMEQGNIAVNATYEALLYVGKAAMQRGESKVAIDYFRQLIQRTKDSNAAEAQYLLATLHYEAGHYQASLTALFELNQKFPAYKEWKNKAFLLIADNYIALGELFQAKATLQSIIDNATAAGIIVLAKEKLATLIDKTASPGQLTDQAPVGTQQDRTFKTLEE